ncbi:sulfotransferase family protein [Leptothoe spongobia]|uniref:Sulfotransferase n=1 Tax=Leptothoe spongobia TAU-MAC 1115 TaxID=1967444 RepID=A0A947DEJ1_9CYAN|nr:sulfotransferase [Leptothoe spongobia]MBT9315572.1 sulfotransferase [Leptothoe spongobia TAU-MAC 1115]
MSSNIAYKKIFIVGCPRSGTSWLKRMISRHENMIPVKNESHIYRLIYEPFTYITKLNAQRRWQRWPHFARHFGVTALLFGATSSDVWKSILKNYQIHQRSNNIGLHHLINYQQLKTLIHQVRQNPGSDLENAQHLIRLILDHYFFEQTGGQPSQFLLEKTPFHIKYADVILKNFPEAKIINVVRDGRAVCASLQARAKKKRWADYDTRTIISQWERCIALSEKISLDPAFSERIYSVKYEELRQDPGTQLNQICNFIDLAITPIEISQIVESCNIENIKNKGAGQHVNKGSINNWKTTLSQEHIDLWHQSAGKTLTRLGYSLA